MEETLLRWWPVIGVALTGIGWFVREAVMYFRRQRENHAALERRVTAQEQAHSSHEDLCGQRWLAAKDSTAQLVKLTDERHVENVGRFDEQREWCNRLEDKIDRLLERP